MFSYDLVGKQVVLIINPESIEALKDIGIRGSPVIARVFKMEEEGLWLENPEFSFCPVGAKKIYTPMGEMRCLAHVFVPSQAIVSIAVFPKDVADLERDPKFHPVGFKP